MIVFIILLLIILVIVLVVLVKRFKNPRIDTINLISGGVGSGKTSSAICRVKRLLFRKYFLWRSKDLENDYIILSNFTIGKPYYESRLDKKNNKVAYRFLKVLGHKIRCYDLNLDVLTMQVKLPQNECILIIDEFSSIASQFDYKNVNVANAMNEFFEYFRHYTEGLGYVFAIDQCSQNIFLQIRRRSNYCYNMISSLKIKFLPIMIFEYRKILISDEVANMIDIKESSDESDIRKFIFLVNPFKWYDSYCFSDRYKLLISKTLNLEFRNTWKRMSICKLINNKPIYYETLLGDGIKEQDYLDSFKKNK